MKTILKPTQGMQRGSKPQTTGENLYIIKTTERPGSCFMLVRF